MNELYEIGDSYIRKDWEYTLAAKVPHESKPGYYVYLMARRRLMTEEYGYHTIDVKESGS